MLPMDPDATHAATPAPPIIALKDVSKRYKLYSSAAHRLADMVTGRRSHRDYWALRGVDLDIQPGETVGVLGENGAGKSTLLRLIAATTSPTAGAVRVGGRIGALLELGAGFHPEWTGRQNAEFQVRMQGGGPRHKPKAAAWLAEIEAFADIGAYYDQPLRTYSSGMAMRVAFAAAASVDPDILIVDEALAVGDAPFQHKCFQRLAQFKDRGVTIVLVTHRLELIPQLCTRCVVLREGRIAFDGAPGEAVNRYIDLLYAARQWREDPPSSGAAGPPEQTPAGYRMGVGGAAIEEVTALGEGGEPAHAFASGAAASFRVRIRFERDVARPMFGFSLKTVEDVCIYGFTNEMVGSPLAAARAGEVVTLRVDCPLRVPAGSVFVDFAVSEIDADGDARILDAHVAALRLTIVGLPAFYGMADLGGGVRRLD
jgi:lipopolysaccharide transport system ATP-binding protein